MPTLTRLQWVILSSLAIGLILALTLTYAFAQGSVFFWVGGALSTIVLGVAVEMIAHPLEHLFANGWRPPNTTCVNILIYGIAGSGKSSMSERFLTGLRPVNVLPTHNFFLMDGLVSINPLKKKYVHLTIAQYSGEDPDQILVHPPRAFFGKANARQVDFVIFMVDLAHALDDQAGRPLPVESVIESFRKRGNTDLAARVRENTDYLSPSLVQTVLRVAGAKQTRLKAVRLVINKFDVLRTVVEKGYVIGVKPGDVHAFAKRQYADLENKIAKVCRNEEINDFKVFTISTTTGEGSEDLIAGLWQSLGRDV